MKEIKIPNSVTKIGDSAFEECGNIKIIAEPNSEAEKYAKKYNISFETSECNHAYDSGKIEIYSSCTQNGKIKYTCLKCGNEYEEVIPATGHKYSNWIATKKPTIFKNGTQTRKCSNCGKQETKTIKKLKSSVSIKKKVSIKAGKTLQLKITRKSKGDKVSSWKSSKKSVATVSKKGKVTARKKGTAKITVKMKSGCKATCTVTVK